MQGTAEERSRGTGAVLLVEDDPQVRSVFTRLLQRSGWQVTAASDGESALEAVASSFFDAIVSDIRLPGLSGVDLLRAVREHDLDVPVILITGWPDVDTAAEAVELGALQYLRKPVQPQQLTQAVEKAIRLHALARAQRDALALLGADAEVAGDRAGLSALFERTLRDMTLVFQPIVSAADPRTTFAYEALLRGGQASLREPESVLEAAGRLGRLPELGRRTRELASRAIGRLPPDVLLFVNLRAGDLLCDGLTDADAPLSPHARRVVLEITEREAVAETRELRHRIERLRTLGYRLALDDLGAGYAGLNSFAALAPEFVKLDRLLIGNCHESEIQQRVVASLAKVCRDLGIRVVAEGIELEEERDAAIALGCDYLQGFLFGRAEAA